MSQFRKKNVLEKVEKHRRDTRIVTLFMVAALIAVTVGGAVHVVTRPALKVPLSMPRV